DSLSRVKIARRYRHAIVGPLIAGDEVRAGARRSRRDAGCDSVAAAGPDHRAQVVRIRAVDGAALGSEDSARAVHQGSAEMLAQVLGDGSGVTVGLIVTGVEDRTA